MAHPVEEVVELHQLVGDPGGALLGEHQLEAGVTFHRPRDEQVGERPM
jgi:hypothetical protein